MVNTSDVVNGNVSSVAALNARPGRDGVSLREALEAARHTGGTATVYIMFSPRLNGRRIWLGSGLFVHRDHVVLEGVAPSGAPARVAIDGRRIRRRQTDALLMIQASDVTVRWLRFQGLDAARSEGGTIAAVQVQAGRNAPPGSPNSSPGPSTVANVRIEDDVFDNHWFYDPDGSGRRALGVLMVGCCPSGTWLRLDANKRWRNITIARNQFLHLTEGVGVWMNSVGTSTTGVLIKHNRFASDRGTYGVEVGEDGIGPRLTGTRIIGNTFAGGTFAITLNSSATNARMDNTLIEDNAIAGAQTAVNLDAGASVPYRAASSDVISNTQVVNNVIRQDTISSTIQVRGGDRTSSPPSGVSGVTIENDTLVAAAGVVGLLSEFPGARGNYITGVVLRNAILYDPNGMPIAQGTFGKPPNVTVAQPPDLVANSLIWARVSTGGNTTADPHFVNLAGGDYHLAAGSPAINTGTTIGAPAYDFDGARRDAQPDIGAYEYGAPPRPVLAITVYPLGGNGTVTGSPAAISCTTTCSAQLDANTKVTLAATPAKGSRFLGWRGACSGTRRCTVTLTASKSVTARFGAK